MPNRATFAPGDRVLLNDGSVRAVVTAVMITAAGVASVECAWWDDGVRYNEWLMPCEVELED